MSIRRVRPEDLDSWLSMRLVLWPETNPDQHRKEIEKVLSNPNRFAVFVCEDGQSNLAAFAEVSLREWAEGCLSSPVGYLEGWYVAESFRRKGVGRALLSASEKWARSQGCTEMASDTDLGNEESETAHKKLGFEIAGRVVTFRKNL